MSQPITHLRSATEESPRPVRHPELDDVTLRRAARGDERAAVALVRLYEARVFALLSRALVGEPADVIEDVAQETFLAVFDRLGQFDPAGTARLGTWILTIASRRAVDRYRRSRRSRRQLTVSIDAIDPDLIAGKLRTDEQASRRELAALVTSAIAELPIEYRAAFVLREYHDFSYDEISAALDIKPGTVKSRLARARRELRQRLEEHMR